MIVINLFGVPGAGKSTGAAYIFSQLKMHGVNAELVTEFTKDKVWEENPAVFKNQAYIFGKQSFKMSRCKDKVEVIVTDSPLLLSALYNEDPILGEDFNKVVNNVFHSYHNMNYLVLRTKPYNAVGRHQTEAESDALAKPMMDLLVKYNAQAKMIIGETDGYNIVIEDVLRRLNNEKI